ncbi:MAG TPA: ABC transporter transmembrane domain-containing protein, partial [Burkholderiaceae bacterium]|nr:ABC transporter transmembrane domain-containing protein [Burkholderiaceae bacterium]
MTSPTELPLRQRVARIAPFFSGTRTGFVLAIIGSVVAASTEPLVPALLRIVLDKGWKDSSFPVWMVPAAIIGLTALRGLAGFIANYGLSWAANRGVIAIRSSMFDRILDAHPSLFTSQSASSLINAVTYQVQGAATQIVFSLQGLVRDSLTLL